MRTAVCYLISVMLHGAALAAMACVSPPWSYQPPQFAIGQGGGTGGDPTGGPTTLESSFSSSSRKVVQPLVRFRIEPVSAARPMAVSHPASASMLDKTTPELVRRRPPPIAEMVSVVPPVIAPAKLSRIEAAEVALSRLSTEAATPERIPAELSPTEVVAGSVAPEFSASNGQTELAGAFSGNDGIGMRGIPTSASGKIGREVRGPFGDGRPGGPGGGGLDQNPSGLPANPLPPYPPEARTNGIQGVVVLRVWIRDSGTVQDVKIHESSGDASLDQSALNTVRDYWRFVAARQDGVSVPCQALVPIRFRIRDGS